ncbi:unnamed protein product, partial [Coregonus sp. 'balchen']
MEDWWTTATIEPSIENHEISGIARLMMSPSRHHKNLPTMHSSTMPLSKSSYNVLSAFCTEDNVPQCISYINQEMDSLGFSSACIEASSPEGSGGLNTVPALNGMYELLQMQRRSQRSLQEQETESLKISSALEHLQITNSRLKDQLELSKREKSGLHEAERQLQLKIKTLQNCLKTEKDERKERESTKLKERLNQLLVDKRDKKLAIDVLNYLGRADGKRSQWKTGKVEARHEGEMYKSLLSDYEGRQRALMLENAELKKVLQQMKREMVSILSPSPRKPCSSSRGDRVEDSLEQAGSDRDKEVGDCSRETLDQSCDHAREQSCEHAREQLTNSIRQQWRRLKSHMERLDSQALLVQQSQQRAGKELVPRQIHEEEMERMRLEVQQCKDFIQTQQQLLQKKAFEEDRASWHKNQFLNITPFVDRKRHSASETPRALSTSSEPEMRIPSTPARLTKSRTYAAFSTPKAAPRGSWQEFNNFHSREDPRVRSRDRYGGGDCCSIFSL